VVGAIITSRSNPLVRQLRLLSQSPTRQTGRCTLEGWRLLAAALDAGARPEAVVYTQRARRDPAGERIRDAARASGAREVVVSDTVFAALTQVESPQGVLAVVARPPDAPEAVLRTPQGLFVVLDGIQDPGNVGTILRTATAAGATAAMTVGAAADPYSSKALRASSGAAFRLPLLRSPKAFEAAQALTKNGVRLLEADPRGERLDSEISFARPLAFVFGSERGGADPVWRRAGAVRVRLPMAGAVESLNVAAAAAVLLYEAAARA
jgi:RNA methyltransferase, TrmH family